MRTQCMLVGLLIAGLAAPSALLAQGKDPRIGRWAERKGTPSYQGIRRSFEDLGDGRVRVTINLDVGERARAFADLACDGAPRPVQGGEPSQGLTLACRPIDARTTAFTFARTAPSGWTTSSGREQVSPDGAVMTVSAVQTDARGEVTARIERVFDRAP